MDIGVDEIFIFCLTMEKSASNKLHSSYRNIFPSIQLRIDGNISTM